MTTIEYTTIGFLCAIYAEVSPNPLTTLGFRIMALVLFITPFLLLVMK